MKIKKFVAQNSSAALKLIRQEFGDDAIILSNKQRNNQTEIISATNYDEKILENNHSAANKVEENVNYNFTNINSEIDTLSKQINQHLFSLAWKDYTYKNPKANYLIKYLLNLGLDCEVIFKMLDDLDVNYENVIEYIYNLLSKNVQFKNLTFKENDTYIFFGLSGSGKTTTLSAIASKYVLEKNNKNILIISLSNEKIGSYESIKTLGKILNVETINLNNPARLKEVIDENFSKDLILIDAPAITSQFQSITNDIPNIKPIYVHSATDQHDINNFVLSKNKIDFYGTIITKLDATTNLGQALSTVIMHDLPILFFTSGLDIPDSMQQVNFDDLINTLIELAKRKNLQMMDELIASHFKDKLVNE